jgi:hypothetical protein
VTLADSAFGQEPLQQPVQAEAPPQEAGENVNAALLLLSNSGVSEAQESPTRQERRQSHQ